MVVKRTNRLNSLLREVISEAIKKEVRNPRVTELITVTRVDISNDLRHAKVFISVIGTEQEKAETLAALNSAAGFIAVQSSRRVVMRYFPELLFRLDDGVNKQMHIDSLLNKITEERESRSSQDTLQQ